MLRRFRRLLPSPAMVVALTALVMSVTGSAYALVITGKTIRNNSVTGRDIHNRSLTGNDVRRDSVGGGSIKESTLGIVPSSFVSIGSFRHAVVNAGGQLVRGRDVSADDGVYQVIFNGDVRNCVYVASIGNPTADTQPPGEVSVGSLATNVNGVEVRTRMNGNPQNRPFQLIVSC
jgi:hypothetical protein